MSRREFLQAVSASGLLWILNLFPELLLESQRTERPPLLKVVAPNSVVFGISPDKNNNFKGIGKKTAFGVQAGLVNYFFDPGQPIQCNFIGENAACGAMSMLSLQMTPSDFLYNQEYIHALAREMGATKIPTLLRPGYEMDGRWLKLGPDHLPPRLFRQAWQQMHTVFRVEGATNVRFVFSPNVTVGAQPFEPWWPGNEYVDITALDTYNKSLMWPPNISPEAALGPDVVALRRLAPKKPFMIAEFNEINDPSFITALIDYATKIGACGISLFDWNKLGENFGETNWKYEDDIFRAQALAQGLQNPAFARGYSSVEEVNTLLKRVYGSNVDANAGVQTH